jgi:hypothetical protein
LEQYLKRFFMQKLVLSAVLVCVSLSSAFSDCNKRGFHGPTHGSRGNVFVYYRNNGNGIVTYVLENRNDFPADVVFAVGDLRDGKFIEREGCAEVTLNSQWAQWALRIYSVKRAHS